MQPPTTIPTRSRRHRARTVGAALVGLAALGAAGCSAGGAPQSSPTTTASPAGTRSTVPIHDGGGPTLDAQGQQLANEATVAFRTQLTSATTAFSSSLGALQAAAATGDVGAARSDELALQADYDSFRTLEASAPADVPHIDELQSDVAPGRPFTGLHAIERDLWASGPLAADVDALAGQTPLQRLLMARPLLVTRQSFGPAAIGSTAVDELTWVVDHALPVEQEQFSHLGLVDVDAATRAADQAFTVVEPLARRVAPQRTARVAAQFAALLAAVQALGDPTTVPDTTVTPAERLALSQAGDATATDLSRLDAALAPYGTGGGGS